MVHLPIHDGVGGRKPAFTVGKFAQQAVPAFIDQHFVKDVCFWQAGLAQTVAAENVNDGSQIIIHGDLTGFQGELCSPVTVMITLRVRNCPVVSGSIESGETERIFMVMHFDVFPAQGPLADKFVVLAAVVSL